MHSLFYMQRMCSWPCRCQEKFCLWLQNLKTSPLVFSAVCLLITLIYPTISSAFLWLIKKLIDTVPFYLVFGHYVHPGKSHFRQQHHCCHWCGERGSYDTASLSVPITSRGKRSPTCLIHLGGSPFQLQNFSLLTIITIYVFSRRHILPRWSSWVFVKKMHFPLSSGKLLAFRWVATSLKSLPLPSLRASWVT